jgi:pyruvate kinase
MIDALVVAGVNVFRLNLSHGTHADHRLSIARVREAAARRGRLIAVLADLQGPRIRIGLIKGNAVELKAGSKVVITTDDVMGDGAVIPTVYKNLPADVMPDDSILIDDGLLKLVVTGVSAGRVECRVEHGGVLKSRKGMNLPGVSLSAPSLTEKDAADVDFLVSENVDYMGLSFVRREADVTNLKKRISGLGADIPVIAKIENAEAVENLHEILAASDGVMIARGDLGVELDLEDVPVLQKRIIEAAVKAGKPVITATQMLDSMINNPRPTRAEASDVANAVFDGTDAVMLSGETAVGKYPVKALDTMSRILVKAEGESAGAREFLRRHSAGKKTTFAEAVTYAAVAAAHEIKAKAIVVFTQMGTTAMLLSKLRPGIPVVAFSPIEATCRRLALSWGIAPYAIEFGGDTDQMICRGESALLSHGLAEMNDPVVIVSGTRVGLKGATNMMKVDWIGSDECKIYFKNELR